MNTFEHEPVDGLPEALPDGERILWQGAPSWKNLARYTFRVRLAAAYFAFFVVLRGVVAYADGASALEAGWSALLVSPLALLGLGLLALMAWAHARSTLYTLTNRRIVMRYGVALPMMVNLPFKAVLSAEFKRRPNGQGDIPIKLGGGTGPGYLHLWPNVRSWRIARPEPMLRGIDSVEEVAKAFAEALIAFREEANLNHAPASNTVAPPMVQAPRAQPKVEPGRQRVQLTPARAE